MATHVREAWVAAERPPLGAFATSIACAGAILGLRGDDGWREWFEIADELSEGALGNKAGVIVMRADIELHQGEVQCAADRFETDISTTWFRSPYLAARAEAYARLGRRESRRGDPGRRGGHRRAPLRDGHPAAGEGDPRR